MALRENVTEVFSGILRRPRKCAGVAGELQSRRDAAPENPPAAQGSTPAAERALKAPAKPVAKAQAGQDLRRAQIAAEDLADLYIKALRPGHYAYRVLKDEFDVMCEDAGIDPISDHRFAKWLTARGGKRYRCNYPKTTMYELPGRASARLAA